LVSARRVGGNDVNLCMPGPQYLRFGEKTEPAS
jgi:hypothetical protein